MAYETFILTVALKSNIKSVKYCKYLTLHYDICVLAGTLVVSTCIQVTCSQIRKFVFFFTCSSIACICTSNADVYAVGFKQIYQSAEYNM